MSHPDSLVRVYKLAIDAGYTEVVDWMRHAYDDRDRYEEALKRMVPGEHPNWVQSGDDKEAVAREALGLPEARC